MVNTKIRLTIIFAAKDGEVYTVNKRAPNSFLGYNLKNYRMISVHLQDTRITRKFGLEEYKMKQDKS